MAAGAMEIDTGKYPIVLSDALLRKAAAKEVYSGIRYNHKAEPSSDSSLNAMQLKPSEDDPTSYDLSYSDNSDKYKYQGQRTKGDGQYVLVFDPVREGGCYVLHQIDSTFDMNLISTPWNQNASELRSQYPQLGPESKPTAPQRRASKATKKAPTAKAAPKAAPKTEPARRKQERAKKPKPAPVREPSPDPQDEEDKADGSGDELNIDWGDSVPPVYQSTPLFPTAPSGNGSDEDAEGEEYEDEQNQDVDHLKLPSPVNNNAGGASEEEMEFDLEAELEQELEQALSSAEAGNESSESEEE